MSSTRSWTKGVAVTLVAVALPTLAFPQEQKPAQSELDVIRHVVTTGVINREPIDAATVFPPSVGALYYFTEVVGAHTPAQISHIWYYDGQKIAEIPLPIASPQWRTWSRKRILPNWIGPWEVEAVDPNGKVLSSQKFDIH